MTLWTIQPACVYRDILRCGQYVCDPDKAAISDFLPAYDWLAAEMTAQIGPPPEGVSHPVWAWYRQNAKRRRPDLRRARWTSGAAGEKMVCMEIEVPDDRVVLSDFDAWSLILNNALISRSEEEDSRLEAGYGRLSPDERIKMKQENWKRVFDISPWETDWIRRGAWVQATFWVLTREMIRDVRFFTAAEAQS